MIEIPISIEVEKRDDIGSIESPADKKRKQKRQQFVSIQSIDETSMSTDDSGLQPQNVQSPKVGHHKYRILKTVYKSNYTLYF